MSHLKSERAQTHLLDIMTRIKKGLGRDFSYAAYGPESLHALFTHEDGKTYRIVVSEHTPLAKGAGNEKPKTDKS